MNPWKVSDDVRLTVPFGHLASSIVLASVLPCRDCVQPIDQTTSAARGLSERARGHRARAPPRRSSSFLLALILAEKSENFLALLNVF